MPRLLRRRRTGTGRGFDPARIGLPAACLISLLLSPLPAHTDSPFKNFQETLDPVVQVESFPDRESVTAGDRFRLHVVVRLSEGWHIYSLHQEHAGDEVATRLSLEPGAFEPAEAWQESDTRLFRDAVHGEIMRVHSVQAEFSRAFRVPEGLKPGAYSLAGTLDYRTCDNRVCSLPRSKPFRSRVIVEEK